ncbi:hypothetical protein KI387_021620, partial [Taxus chinensis]
MELISVATTTYSLVAGILILILFVIVKKKNNNKLALPPGPPGWPVIGNLHQLGDKPHQSLFHLAQKYGPLMTLKLGMKTVLVVSSPSMANEVLKIKDQNFSSRTVNIAVKTFTYQGSSLVWSPIGPIWRLIRKICNTEIFSAKRMDAMQHFRREEVSRTIDTILEDYKEGKSVTICEKAFMISLNLIGKMVCNKQIFEPGSAQAAEFRDMVLSVLQLMALPNISDHFPFLERFDLQGLNRKNKRLAQRFDNLFDRIINERLAQRVHVQCNGNGNEEMDFLDVMLDMAKDSQLTLENIKGTLLKDQRVKTTNKVKLDDEDFLDEIIEAHYGTSVNCYHEKYLHGDSGGATMINSMPQHTPHDQTLRESLSEASYHLFSIVGLRSPVKSLENFEVGSTDVEFLVIIQIINKNDEGVEYDELNVH